MATKGIYKRGAVYWICYKGIDGRMIRESSRSTKFNIAVAMLTDRRKDIQDGHEPEMKRISNHSFKELAMEYIAWAERQRGFRQKQSIVRQLVNVFGQYSLRAFTSRLLEQYQTERMQKGNKAATINRHIATIKHMFTKAVEWDMVAEGALKRIRKAKLLEESNRRLKYLCKEDCQALVDNCDKHIKPIVTIALYTGMRKSEILQLKWDNVDLKHGFILLELTKNGERREIPINARVREALTGITRRLDVPYVFYDPITGKPYEDIKRSFTSACRRAGINDFRFHDLRHTFASQLVMAGVDLTTVKELLGHKTLTMTLRYAHLAPSHKVKAVDLLDRVINA
jgi:integrase